MYLNSSSTISLMSYYGDENASNIPMLYVDNVTFSSFSTSTYGAILFSNDSITITFNSCTFLNSAAQDGGSLYFYDNVNGNIVINECLFLNNNAASNGGAIVFQSINNRSHCDISILLSKFEGNSVNGQGGAISIVGNIKKINILNTTFVSNTATQGITSISLFLLFLITFITIKVVLYVQTLILL